MTPDELKTLIRLIDPSFNPAYTPHAWNAFCAEMKHRNFGADESEQAWDFFLAGWKAGTCA